MMSRGSLDFTKEILAQPRIRVTPCNLEKNSTVLLHIHTILSHLSFTKTYGGGGKVANIFPVVEKGKREALNG